MADIILDPSIRDWVVLPMVLVMVLIGLTRHYVSLLLKSEKPVDVNELKNRYVSLLYVRCHQSIDRYDNRQTIQRSQILRNNSAFISPLAFSMRKVCDLCCIIDTPG